MQTTEWKILDTAAFDAPLKDAGWSADVPPTLADGVLLVRHDFSSNVEIDFDSLSQEEADRADRFKFPEHQDRYRIGRALLREVLSLQLDCEAKAVQIATGEHGKPYLPNNADTLHFNVAHTDTTLLIACTRGKEIGVDVEKMDRIATTGLDRMYRFVCHQDEIPIWENCPEAERPLLFTRLWTMKEALLKARGSGLMLEPRTINISAFIERGHGQWEHEGQQFQISGGSWGMRQHMAVAILAYNPPSVLV